MEPGSWLKTHIQSTRKISVNISTCNITPGQQDTALDGRRSTTARATKEDTEGAQRQKRHTPQSHERHTQREKGRRRRRRREGRGPRGDAPRGKPAPRRRPPYGACAPLQGELGALAGGGGRQRRQHIHGESCCAEPRARHAPASPCPAPLRGGSALVASAGAWRPSLGGAASRLRGRLPGGRRRRAHRKSSTEEGGEDEEVHFGALALRRAADPSLPLAKEAGLAWRRLSQARRLLVLPGAARGTSSGRAPQLQPGAGGNPQRSKPAAWGVVGGRRRGRRREAPPPRTPRRWLRCGDASSARGGSCWSPQARRARSSLSSFAKRLWEPGRSKSPGTSTLQERRGGEKGNLPADDYIRGRGRDGREGGKEGEKPVRVLPGGSCSRSPAQKQLPKGARQWFFLSHHSGKQMK